MDYYKIYKTQYDSCYNETESYIKGELITFIEKKKDYTLAHNTISSEIYAKISSNTISTHKIIGDLHFYFRDRRAEYTADFTRMSLENETLDKFNTLAVDDLPANYTYESFCSDLALYRSYNEINRLFRNHQTLYNMMYLREDFGKFKIEDYNGIALEDTKIFRKLHKALYPPQYANLISGTNEQKTSSYNDAEFAISKFTSEEKLLLLHVCYKALKKIPVTEFSKLMLITNNINDFRIFIEEPSKNQHYTRVSKGIDAYTSIDKKRDLINSTIDKIGYFKLPAINKELNLIKKNI